MHPVLILLRLSRWAC